MKRKVLSIFILSANLLNLTAQNMTNSPASMFGLGELSTGEGGIYSGMGGVGIALRGENAYNSANPASLTGLMPQYFFFDLGVSGAYEKYSQSGANNHSFNGNLNNLGAGFRIAPRWYGAIFMAPVSSVGYAISLEQDVAGTNGETVTSLFQGEGGLSKVGISVAHQLWKGLSLGANFSYVGGTITQSESQGSATETNSSYKHTVYVDFGLQYTYEIERDRSLVAGAVYGYSQDLLQDNDHSVSTGTPIESLRAGTDYNLFSSESDHQVYLQGLTGMYINLEFPHLNNLNQKGRLVSIESAVLKLYPIKGTYNGKYPLPKSLTLYTADQNNSTQSVITDLSGNSVQTGNLVEDNVYYEDTHYSFDITSFIQNNLGTAGQSREKLQLFLSDNDFYNTVQGVIFGDSKHPVNDHNNNVSLTIYYKTYTK